jgi:hypothetical protein
MRVDSRQISGTRRRQFGPGAATRWAMGLARNHGATPALRSARPGRPLLRAWPGKVRARARQQTELWLFKLISGSLPEGKVSCRTFRVGQLRSRVFGLVTDPPEPFFPNTVFVNAVPATPSVLVEPQTQHRIGRLTQVFV